MRFTLQPFSPDDYRLLQVQQQRFGCSATFALLGAGGNNTLQLAHRLTAWRASESAVKRHGRSGARAA